MLASIGTWLEHFHGPPLYLLCGFFVFAEAAFLLGFVIPGETAAVVGGAVAALGHANLETMIVVIVLCAIVGDSVGYEVGKVMGPYLLERRPLQRNVGVHKARALLVRFGGPAVFLGRWVALARALVPGLTGMSGMRYRTFLFYNALGGLVWGTTFVLIGYAAGRSWEAIAKRVGTYAIYVLVALAVAAAVVFVVRKRRERAERAALAASEDVVAGDHDPGREDPGAPDADRGAGPGTEDAAARGTAGGDGRGEPTGADEPREQGERA